LEDRAAALIDGLAPDSQSLDAPAERLRRIGPCEVFVQRAFLDQRHEALEVPGRDDGQGRDRPAGATQDGVVVLGLAGVDLAVEDGQCDVAADIEGLLDLTWMLDLDDLEAGGEELGGDARRFAERKCDGDRWSGHV
jgi:hypothetical protein